MTAIHNSEPVLRLSHLWLDKFSWKLSESEWEHSIIDHGPLSYLERTGCRQLFSPEMRQGSGPVGARDSDRSRGRRRVGAGHINRVLARQSQLCQLLSDGSLAEPWERNLSPSSTDTWLWRLGLSLGCGHDYYYSLTRFTLYIISDIMEATHSAILLWKHLSWLLC